MARNKAEELITQRAAYGLNDAVLLPTVTESAFIENLRKRFKNAFPYTYIGQNVVSVNPYKTLPIYDKATMESYRNVNFYELPPHLYALADNAYRIMIGQSKSQCILISGESGSGKTEASKYILQYLTNVKPSEQAEKIKNRLIQSNPLLESFGNATTNKNDNSSRFGKYMDVEFDYKGLAVGGHILNYLLEKARVCTQNQGERNFHIFYQLMTHEEYCSKFKLTGKASDYKILGGKKTKSDSDDFKLTLKAMSTSGLSDSEQESLLKIIATILHLGNVEFQDAENAELSDNPKSQDGLRNAAKCLGVTTEVLSKALTKRTIEARGNTIETDLDKDAAEYARNAMNKALYSKTFDWLVQKINAGLRSGYGNRKSLKRASSRNVIGLLDIYGFEIFDKNVFEQFCINYCNEKLQQLCVQLTLKQEQEEYKAEGIEWQAVDFFDNIPICKMIEGKPKGILAVLDEECRLPGERTDKTFLDKLQDTMRGSQHFVPHAQDRKNISHEQFKIKHYAGDVVYDIENFLEKNNDAFYRDLKTCIKISDNEIAQNFFTEEDIQRKKQPETAGTQFKNSLNKLMDILMSKEPSYVRCIKPNEHKSSAQFDDRLVNHQVKYLGLMENLRIRRAGFVYRRPYTEFLTRYKCLASSTWPAWRGAAQTGVEEILKAQHIADDGYQLGRTKIFIKDPKTIFQLEDALQARKHELITIIAARWRGFRQQRYYQQLRQAQVTFAKVHRGNLARKAAMERKKAVLDLRRFVKGFIQRRDPVNDENKYFVQQVRIHYLRKCKENLPQSILTRDSWPEPPANCVELSGHLKDIWQRNWVRNYCVGMPAKRKEAMEEKLDCSDVFKGNRPDYAKSVGTKFDDSRHSVPLPAALSRSSITYTCLVNKFNNKDLKMAKLPQELYIGKTGTTIFSAEKSKFKRVVPMDVIEKITVSNLSDQLVIFHISPTHLADKKAHFKSGDFIINVLAPSNIFELITKVRKVIPNLKVEFCEEGSIQCAADNTGKLNTVLFQIGSQSKIEANKQKQLVATSKR